MSERIRGYRAFWHYYVAEHSRPATRRLHFVGTTGAVALVVAAAVLRASRCCCRPRSSAATYFAWLSHLLIERNRPATFTYPLFSLAGDFHMWALMWQGRMDAEIERLAAAGESDRAGVVAAPASDAPLGERRRFRLRRSAA